MAINVCDMLCYITPLETIVVKQLHLTQTGNISKHLNILSIKYYGVTENNNDTFTYPMVHDTL